MECNIEGVDGVWWCVGMLFWDEWLNDFEDVVCG